jgi:MFS family permease
MKSGLTKPLRQRNFRRLTTGRTFTEFGNAVAPVALAFAVLDLTGSAIDLGLVVGARSLASVLLLLFGGVLADRLPRSVILQGTEIAATLTQATIAASVLFGFASIPLLLALSLANGAVAALSLPAAAAITPQTVPADLLTQANALARMLSNIGRITGAALGGILVAGIGSGWAIGVNAVFFLLAAASYRRVKLGHSPRTEKTRPLADLVEGWHEFISRTWVWVVVAQFMVVNAIAFGMVLVLGPIIADATFGRAGWGFVLAAETAGAFAGGIVAARWRPRRALMIGVAAILLDVVPMVTLAEYPRVLPLLITMFAAGLALEQFGVAWDVSLQENIPPDKLARVYSYDMLGSFIAMPVGQVAAGPLAEHFGRENTLLAGAAIVAVTTGLTLCGREVRGLVRKAPNVTPTGI